ncbi:deoxyuridine 5'-triphosphate nucleotidohydrolase [Frankia sp. CcI156]|uniref:Deoxyuridine 5'-triphosphate nucleotidohydrolase n=1 Tax=Frankia casuarinae (strain DSM 45818 / CECT 9043 / HFP020203 / CcI3) TaxID=106370 RepID=Q2JDE7_FRACC|nr:MULTISPECIES: dUTP diphosphatase [Frankia]ABD10695.1 deoxyuridine 5'-triphosphate nucleotidohydrolase [Frankia casuarinae]ETA00702.1 deoxyuridine 5'-triphosphate nucleotidohydrolase [Frankia sp. CcI6]EYT93247.1 deoxyuridine 5'-triphosphate nucleotidohydrolase [Frankia casuarinae]KDA41712.1 deoxyuridine 5'-triphosphate nucleotidohydrolase [Frankia sp. BMG5.23]OAA20963.1 deoxyuridine 5'-triphosphate nucleotidohydrolase [Frankia casuarinae]
MTATDPTTPTAPPTAPPPASAVPLAVQPAPAVPGRVEILVRRSDRELALPAYAQPSDAGADLVTAQDVTLGPGERATVGTGLSIALPAGYAAFVHPRSGLAARHGLSVVNAPGTVDAGYRGEIKVVLINTDRSDTIILHRGDRIAQLVVQRVEHAVFREVDELPASVRGSGGFGSTGGFGSAGGAGKETTGVRTRT